MNDDPFRLFRLLADPTRLRLMVLLAEEGELCVCELTWALEMVQPKVSRHLGVLRDAGVVVDRRVGQWVFYRLSAALPSWAEKVIGAAVEGAASREPFQGDRARLASMVGRPGEHCS